jgi:hypothetical protein
MNALWLRTWRCPPLSILAVPVADAQAGTGRSVETGDQGGWRWHSVISTH